MQHVYFNRKFEFLKEHQETTSGKTETEFEIEKILDKRGAGRTLQYFVKWKVSHHQGCPTAVRNGPDFLVGGDFLNQFL